MDRHLGSNEVVERRCRALETKAALDLDAVETAIAGLHDPDLVRQRLGHALLYAQRVEAEVAQLPIEAAFPHQPEDYMGRFLAVWTPDETGHGHAQERLLGAVGLEPAEAVTDDDLTAQVVGVLGRVSTRLEETVLMLYHTVGAMNERLAMSAYQDMGRIAAEIGEPELADVLFAPMRRDESLHLGYYRIYAQELGKRLRPWQLAVVRWLMVRTYAPVGARRLKHRPSLGRTLISFGVDPGNHEIADRIQAIAEELLAAGDEMVPFARRAMVRCMDAARAEDDADADGSTVVDGRMRRWAAALWERMSLGARDVEPEAVASRP